MKYLVLLTIGIFAAGCGDIGSKPNEPVPNGGPGGTPNSIFPNVGTNNVDPNNVDPNVGTNNVDPNVGTNNIAPNNVGNNQEVCGPLPAAPEQQVGFSQATVDTVGFVSFVSSDFIEIDTNEGILSFFSVGIDLEQYFGQEDEVFLFGDEFVAEGPEPTLTRFGFVEGPNATVEYVIAAQSLENGEPQIRTTTAWDGRSVGFGEPVEAFSCAEPNECGPQTRTQTTYDVNIDGTSVSRFETAVIGSSLVYVHEASSLVYEPVFGDGCEVTGSGNGALVVMLANQ